MTEAVLGLPPSVRRRLADALESGLLAPPYTPVAIRSTLGGIGDQDQLIYELQGWERAGISGEAAAAWISSLEEVSSRFLAGQPCVDRSRRRGGCTPAALGRYSSNWCGTREESILISSYTYFDGPEAFKVLASQMDQAPFLASDCPAEHQSREVRIQIGSGGRSAIRRSPLERRLAGQGTSGRPL